MSQKINVQSTIASPVDKVWSYYNLPEHIVKWNFAHPSWHCPAAKNDLRVGGKYWSRMEARDGSFGFDFEAEYTDVVLGEKLVYQMSDGRVAQVIFKREGEQTCLEITFDAETENPVEMQKGGWQAILDNFKHYVESN